MQEVDHRFANSLAVKSKNLPVEIIVYEIEEWKPQNTQLILKGFLKLVFTTLKINNKISHKVSQVV
jgi:hypothetical protein